MNKLSDLDKQYLKLFAMIILTVVVVKGADYTYNLHKNSQCDFRDNPTFIFEYEDYIESISEFDKVVIFRDGIYHETFEYRNTEYIACQMDGVIWISYVRFPVKFTVYIREYSMEKSFVLSDLYKAEDV